MCVVYEKNVGLAVISGARGNRGLNRHTYTHKLHFLFLDVFKTLALVAVCRFNNKRKPNRWQTRK